MIKEHDINFGLSASPDDIPRLAGILVDLLSFIRRFVVITDHQAVAVALWTAHTHSINAADCTGYLQITSATKRAGKTRLLEVLEPLVARPWFTGRTSAAALVRKIDSEQPTLLLDESDAAFGGDKDYAEALRGILNTGYRRSGKATVCTGQGTNITARDFRTFAPKAIAGIGALPDTVADRSIAIQLRRRSTDEPCERWRERDGHADAEPIRRCLEVWAVGAVKQLRDARPDLPSALSDRQADCWEPLIAIADLAGDDWPRLSREAAVGLAGRSEDTDIAIELVSDLATIIANHSTAVIGTRELIEKLVEQDDRPWATWTKGKPITAHKLARLLRPLDVHVVHQAHGNGYRVDAIIEAIVRYLPSKASDLHLINSDGPESRFSTIHTQQTDERSKSAIYPMKSDASEELNLQTLEKGDDSVGRF